MNLKISSSFSTFLFFSFLLLLHLFSSLSLLPITSIIYFPSFLFYLYIIKMVRLKHDPNKHSRYNIIRASSSCCSISGRSYLSALARRFYVTSHTTRNASSRKPSLSSKLVYRNEATHRMWDFVSFFFIRIMT